MIKLNTRFNIAGETVTTKEFMEIEGLSKDEAIRQLDFMVKSDFITIIPEKETKWERLMREAREKMAVEDKVAMIDKDKEQTKMNKRMKDMDTALVHDEVKILYPSLLKCQEDARAFYNELGLRDAPEVYESKDQDGYILVLRNITDEEFNAINKKIQTDDMVEGIVNTTTGVVEAVTDTADSLARNVVTPVAKITTRAAGKTGKIVGVTAMKAGANLINSSAEALREGKEELATSEDMLRARSEVRELGRNLKNLFGFKKKSSRIM